ncbi:MAG: hypothetical protein CL831_10115 [Crocinitomicaceae bacterium]|nr:hypothetical protein [Crocinitomicaceae bacterium]
MRCFATYFNFKKRIFLSFFQVFMTCLCLPSVNAQFVNASNDLQLFTDHTGGYLGSGVSFADFNGDDIDDLTFGHHAGQIRYYQGDGVGFEEIQLNIDNDVNESKSVLWADIDNDGDQDLLITNRNASNRLWMNNGNMQFTDITSSCGISTSSISRSYGASFGDYDNDGFIDLYICNYHTDVINIKNELYHNNGDGTFTDVTVSSGVGNGLQQSFQSTWIDIDKDRFLDLYVINDRLDYPNSFYLNNGDGTFVDMAPVWGADLEIYAMSSTFADYDCDGDMDLYVTNGSAGNVLLSNNLNQGMGFVNVTSSLGVEVNQLCWGACFIDHLNDSWLDLYVGTGFSVYTDYPNIFEESPALSNAFFTSNGTGSLDVSSELSEELQHTFAMSTGDFNNDGFPDLVSHQVGLSASVISAIPNENHYLKVRPQGTTVNRDAIGSEVYVYHSSAENTGVNAVKVDVVFCGDKYLSQNSRHLQFGLGSSTQVDSVVIQWPGGFQETFLGISIDSSVVLVEGSSIQDCPNPASFCGSGTIWNEATQTCVSFQEDLCPTDVNNDGFTSIQDLLELLGQFGTFCPTTW